MNKKISALKRLRTFLKFGVVLPSYGASASKDAILSTALEAEKLRYDSIWTTDHVLVPKQFKDLYGRLYSVTITLAYVAAVTETVSLGTSVLVAPLRHPAVLAKELATLDALSGGRLIVGAAAGYMKNEFEYLGVDFHTRGRRFEETVQAMRAIWREDESDFSGEFFEFAKAYSYPKPTARNRPPIWIGGASDSAIRRAATIGDGWHPNGGMSPQEFAAGTRKLRSWSHGRKVTLSLRQTVDLRPSEKSVYLDNSGVKRYKIAGSPRQIVRSIEEYSQSGLDHLVCEFEEIESPRSEKPGHFLGRMRRFAEEVVPSFQ